MKDAPRSRDDQAPPGLVSCRRKASADPKASRSRLVALRRPAPRPREPSWRPAFPRALGDADWAGRRADPTPLFKRLAGNNAVYVGEVIRAYEPPAGAGAGRTADRRPAADLARRHTPSVVTVTEDMATGSTGPGFTRRTVSAGGAFVQALRRTNRAGEYVGRGVGMAHDPCKRAALIFRAAHYFLQLGSWRSRLPRWASPGSLSVTHAELGDGRFLFKLDIIHPRLGRLICQTAAFQEAQP